MGHFRQLWWGLRASFWFVPGLILLCFVALALLAVAAETWLPSDFTAGWPSLFAASASGARSLLQVIAGSMITVAGVVFSITLVALSLTASQYSPRVLRNFMRNAINQSVLGIFVGIFAYALVVLRTIRSPDEGVFIPNLAVLLGLLLGFLGIAFLIFFTHHIARSIQVAQILADIHCETSETLARRFDTPLAPGELDDDSNMLSVLPDDVAWHSVVADCTGYMQMVDQTQLVRVAREYDVVVRLERDVGQFCIAEAPIVSVLSARPPSPDVAAAIRRTVVVGRQRTIEADPGFGVQQVVDIALRALSPGINDTTTASMSVDYLTAILVQASGRQMRESARDGDGRLRVLGSGPTFAGLVRDGFWSILRNATTNVEVLTRLVAGLEVLEGTTQLETRRLTLRALTEVLLETVQRCVEAPVDRAALLERSGALLDRWSD